MGALAEVAVWKDLRTNLSPEIEGRKAFIF